MRPDDIFVSDASEVGDNVDAGNRQFTVVAERRRAGARVRSGTVAGRPGRAPRRPAAVFSTLAYRPVIKTHSPADCTPIFTECRYLAVSRDGPDALVSWANHRRKMRPEVIEALNAAAALDGVAPWPPVWNGDMDQLFDEWVDWGSRWNTWLRGGRCAASPSCCLFTTPIFLPTSTGRCGASPNSRHRGPRSPVGRRSQALRVRGR